MLINETLPDAVGAQVERGVGRLVNAGTVAALCVAPNSLYKTMPGVECYDQARDVRSFTGGMPVVAHPPCRAWSAYTAHYEGIGEPRAVRALGIVPTLRPVDPESLHRAIVRAMRAGLPQGV